MFVEEDVTVVNVACVEKVKAGLLEKREVGMPGVFNECDGNIAECWRELAADACALYLLVVGVAGFENAGLECVLNDEGNVLGVNGALLRMVNVVPADM